MYDAVTHATIDPLALMAEKAAGEVYFLAHALAVHREKWGLTEGEQRRHLGVLAEHWPMFQLCRCPVPERWDEDMAAIAERFGCDRERLGRALKAAN
jgi:hypothetical protein